jgi:DNA-binding NtrC family response regulator
MRTAVATAKPAARRLKEGDARTMGDRRRILIVDDDERVRFILTDALRRMGEGYEVVPSASCREALEQAQATTFDLLITDLRMPRSDGLALTSAFAKVSPQTRVVWMTAHGCYHYREPAKRLDVVQCLDKPLEIWAIRRAALAALASDRSDS